MSCPRTAQWPALVAHRLDLLGQEPEGWDAALDHLPGCPECRRAALAADPTLVFKRLAAVPELPDDVFEMQRAVAAMRTASRIVGGDSQPARSARVAAGKRWAAAAVLVLAAGSTGDGWRELPEMPAAPAVRVAAELQDGALRLPMVEELDRPAEWVHELPAPNFTITMMYDKRFNDL